jgi:excisionase family DNA binding protein
METKLLSTGQAARLCSVTPDTILKWIRSGRLPARQTAGGHNRIDRKDLERFIGPAEPPSSDPPHPDPGQSFRYCWQHNSTGEVMEGCAECVVYRLRAQRCYEVLKLSPDIGHNKLFCEQDCRHCDYFRRVHVQATNVLVITGDETLADTLKRDATSAPYNLEVTDCEYNCSALVDRFRADYAVVDCALGPDRSTDICSHLMQDPRIPYVRIILAVSQETEAGGHGRLAAVRDGPCGGCGKNRDVFARIERPFRLEDVTQCLLDAQN